MSSAFAATDSGGEYVKDQCDNQDDASLKSLTESLKYFDQVLPNIPPEEEKYLVAESKAVDRMSIEEAGKKRPHTSSARRYAALTSRRLYYVWQVRQKLSEAIIGVNGILNPKAAFDDWMSGKTDHQHYYGIFQSEEANKLDRAMFAISDLTILRLSLQEFLIREEYSNGEHLLTNDEWQRTYSETMLLPDLSSYMLCKLAKVAPLSSP